jgi:hypothetical protein
VRAQQVIAFVCFLFFGGMIPTGTGSLLRWRSTGRDGWSPCSNECGPGFQVRSPPRRLISPLGPAHALALASAPARQRTAPCERHAPRAMRRAPAAQRDLALRCKRRHAR